MRNLLFALLLSAGPASAFELKTDRDGDVVRWATPVHFVIDAQLDEKLHVKGAVEAVQAAVKTWTLALPNVGISASTGDVTAAPAKVTVIERDWPYDPNVYAVTICTLDYVNNRIVGADIYLNGAQHQFAVLAADSRRGGHLADVQNTITHELGHAFGLQHEQAHAEAVMFPVAYDGDVDKRQLSSDDVEGLDVLYPLEGGAMSTAPAGVGCSVGGGAAAQLSLLLLLALKRRRG